MGRLRLDKGQIKHEFPLLCFFLFASYCCEWNSKAKARSEGKTTDGPHIQRSKWKRNLSRNGSRYGRDGPRNGRWDEWRIWTWKCIRRIWTWTCIRRIWIWWTWTGRKEYTMAIWIWI